MQRFTNGVEGRSSGAATRRLLVDAGVGSERPKQVVKKAAEAAFGRLDEPFGVAYLFGAESANDDELGRFLEVVVTMPGLESPWDRAYALQRELPSGYSVEPDLPSAFGAPDLDQAAALSLEESTTAYDWALKVVRAREAWALEAKPGCSTRGAGVVVGHPDTGYVLHAELEASALDLTRDTDVIDGDDDASDPLESGRFPEFLQPGHGSRTASVIVGRETGVIVGVAPQALLIPIRTVRSVIQVLDGDVAKAVDYARRIGCQIISMSIGGLGFSGLEEAINRAVREGVIVLAAAGNFVPLHLVCWPARYRNCLAVAAVNSEERPWKPGSHGEQVDVSAPGEAVWVPDLSNTNNPPVKTSSGTSFAVTHVAGAAACWLSYHGHEQLVAQFGRENVQAAFVDALNASSRTVNTLPFEGFGAGILDVEALLREPLADPTSLPQFTEAVDVVTPPGGDLYVLFPDLDRQTVDRRLASALGVTLEREQQLVTDYGRELFHLVAEDRVLHQRLADDASLLESETNGPLVSGQRFSLELARAVGQARAPDPDN